MEEEDRRESRRERRARKKEEKSGARPPEIAGRQVYPQPGGQVPVAGQGRPRPGEQARGAQEARPPAATPAGPGIPEAPEAAGQRTAAGEGTAPAPRPQGPPKDPRTPQPQQPQPQPQPQQPQPPQQPQQPGYPGPQQPPPQYQPPPGYYWPPPWYPPAFAPPGYGYPVGYPPGAVPVPGAEYMPGMPLYPPPPLPEQTGQMPAVPPGAPQAVGWPPGPGPTSGLPPPGDMTVEEAEFRGLTGEETTHWRVDLKWIFGILTTLLLFATLTIAGFYQVSGPGVSREILEPLVDETTDVRELVEDNYQELRGKARRSKTASFVIPDIGVQVTVKAEVINTVTADDLADRVVSEVAKQIYARGYRGNLPMPDAQGVGEERAKAVAATLLSVLNNKTHKDLLWPMIVLAVLTVAIGVLFCAFCRGWGRALGAGVVIIAGTLPSSLFIRIANEFIIGSNTGIFKNASHQALRSLGRSMLMFYDIALAAGALVLLGGVIGVVIAKKTRDRVPPFGELERPEQAVVGGPPLEPGLATPPHPPSAPPAPPGGVGPPG